MNRFRLFFVFPTLVALVVAVWPLVAGMETLFLRDVFNTHLEMKWMQAEAMRAGAVPLIDDLRSGGQAHVGNPNTVPLYPDNALYLLLPFFWVFNAHFWVHLLLAPFGVYWLAREWGLRRESAWASAVVYVTCGYFLSNFSFYNLVAGVALAPALAAALLRAGRAHGRAWGFAASAVLWCLLLLSGDPIVAALGALFGGVSLLLLGEEPGRFKFGLAAGLLGTVMAAPQLVEFLRVLPLTFRGLWGYSLESALTASWNPRTLLDWLLPLPYGEPSFDFWGIHLFGGEPPLYYTFYPGVLALLLVAVSGVPRSRSARLAWGWTLAGLFFALGAYNPLLAWLLEASGVQLVRFPVKFWLLVALGSALLCGFGVERWMEGRGRRSTAAVALAAAAAYGALALWLRWDRSRAAGALRGLIPERFDADLVDQERLRWAALATIAAAVLATTGGLALLVERRIRPAGVVAALLLLHTGTQLVVLRSLLPTDDVDRYTNPPPSLSLFPSGSRVVHGSAGSLFGKATIDPRRYPDRSFVHLQRQTFSELYPARGALHGLRFDLQLSPEGLDAFRTRAAVQAVQRVSDDARLRLLEAWGVDRLIVDRPLEGTLDGALAERVERIGEFSNSLDDLRFVYALERSMPESRFVGRIVPQGDLGRELRALTDPGHDPVGAVIVASGVEPLRAPAGSLEVIVDERERWRGVVESRGGGAVVLQRTNLPIYRASIDGEPTEVLDADLHRVAVRVPPGRHEVTLEIDRRPWRVAWVVALLALLEVGVVWRRVRGER